MNILRRFHEEESGQLSFLAIAGVVCFIGLLSMVMNTDDIITERIRMQDIADTTAISSAAWTARGLNMISFINVLNAKLISTAVLLNALADTLPVVQRVGEIQLAVFNACSGVPFVGAFCAAMAVVVNIQLNVLRPLTNAVRKLADKLSRCGGSKKGLLWSFMKTLEGVSTVIKNTFTLIGLAEGIAMAKANGADMGIVVNGKMVDLDDAKSGTNSNSGDNPLSLPVVKDKFKAFCPFVKSGGSGFKMAGYECGKGPFKLGKERINKTILVPFVNLFAHPIFMGMSAQHFTMIGCTPDKGDNKPFDVMLKNLAECKHYRATAKWAHVYSKTPPIEQSNLSHKHFAPWKPKSKQKGGKDDADARKKKGEVEDGIKDIKIPDGPEDREDAVTRQFQGGQYYDLLQNEQTPMAEIPAKCNGSAAYPLYAPPEDGFDSDEPGNTRECFIFNATMPQCKRITTYGQFQWYSGEHKPGVRPENTGGYFMRVGKRKVDPPEDDKNAPPKYVYIVETISLIDSGTAKMNQKQFQDYLNKDAKKGQKVDTKAKNQTEKCEKPEPYVLDIGTGQNARENFEDQLRFIGVVWRKIDKDPPFWSSYFKTPPKTIMTYSQAQVYNHLSEDTFTQDWRVRLEQASLLETLLSDKKGDQLGDVGGFAGVIRKVNNH